MPSLTHAFDLGVGLSKGSGNWSVPRPEDGIGPTNMYGISVSHTFHNFVYVKVNICNDTDSRETIDGGYFDYVPGVIYENNHGGMKYDFTDVSQSISIGYIGKLGNLKPYIGFDYGFHDVSIDKIDWDIYRNITSQKHLTDNKGLSGYLFGIIYPINKYEIFVEYKHISIGTDEKLNLNSGQINEFNIGLNYHFDLFANK